MQQMKRIVILVTALTLLAGFAGGAAWGSEAARAFETGDPDPAAMLVDVTSTRPLGMVSIVAGTATFVVSLPFSLLGGNTGSAFNSLIISPVKYTFFRPLGYI